jgi:dimethylamine/trimethylamine dehydrogenase
VVIYDDEQNYMASVIADHIAATHRDITFISSAGCVSAWTHYSLEQTRIQSQLIKNGVKILTNRRVTALTGDAVQSVCLYGGDDINTRCTTLILVTERFPGGHLAEQLQAVRSDELTTLEIIGDGYAPGLIADAVYSGHLAARNFQRDPLEVEQELYNREIPTLN